MSGIVREYLSSDSLFQENGYTLDLFNYQCDNLFQIPKVPNIEAYNIKNVVQAMLEL